MHITDLGSLLGWEFVGLLERVLLLVTLTQLKRV